jgi:hypothetical protein
MYIFVEVANSMKNELKKKLNNILDIIEKEINIKSMEDSMDYNNEELNLDQLCFYLEGLDKGSSDLYFY